MAWATPLYQVQEVNAAGKMLAKAEIPTVDEPYLTVINNWRSSHSYPLNTFQITLRNRAKKYEKDITVAQRIKRLESIHAKLSRQSTMRLSQMQDIAGCRVVFKSVNNVRKLANRYKTSSFDHIFRGEKTIFLHQRQMGIGVIILFSSIVALGQRLFTMARKSKSRYELSDSMRGQRQLKPLVFLQSKP